MRICEVGMQNKFAFFSNFAETIKSTLPADKQAEAYMAICEYGIYGTLPEDPMLKMMCLMAKSSIYSKGGAPEGNQNAKKTTEKQPQNNLKQPKTTQNNSETTPLETETRNKKLETETETRNKKLETESKATSRPYAFVGKVIRLTPKDFDSWLDTFPDLNLRAELVVRDDYLAKQSETEQKNWFMSTFQYFIKQNAKRKSQNDNLKDEETEDLEDWLRRSV